MDFKLNSSGDIDMSGLQLQLVSGVDAIKQHIIIRLKFFFKEWFLDETMGMPYREYILLKNPNMPIVESLFKDVILSTDGVLSPLKYFELTFDSTLRNLKVSFIAETIEGDLTITDEIIGVE